MYKPTLLTLLTVFFFYMHSNAQAPADKKDENKLSIRVEITDIGDRINDHNFIAIEENELLKQVDSRKLAMIESYYSNDDYPDCIQELLKDKTFKFADFKLYKIAEFENQDDNYNAYNFGISKCAILILPAEENKKAMAGCKIDGDIYIVINSMGIKEKKDDLSFLELFSSNAKSIDSLLDELSFFMKSDSAASPVKAATGSCVTGNCINGKGIYKYPSGNLYDGEFRNSKMNGKGKYNWSNGTVYNGEFKDDKLDGKGKLTMQNGDKYDGEFVDGKKNGKGIYTFANGDYYDGTFADDKYNGNGIFYIKATDKYLSGYFKNGQFQY